MTAQPKTLAVPLEMAIACASPLALAALKLWVDLGARPKRTARVMMVGCRLMAAIDFENPIIDHGRPCDGMALPLIVTLHDGSDGDGMLARVKAGDRLVERLREELRRRGGDRRP